MAIIVTRNPRNLDRDARRQRPPMSKAEKLADAFRRAAVGLPITRAEAKALAATIKAAPRSD